ncbi:MAG: selenocysteine-specific translation elongation factor [Phycisphaerae bacterium]|nr:selenocysteine-specific translation elongation factor [Phycisphaerae bacterium]
MKDKKQINITLGTAGHIDHGKTALIRNLTGCETDRLKVEKERGMSIELGFAPCRIADLEVGIVDVPGHENFIKTMVAGAGSIDGVIFVVAADDGIMPQTREHLEILTLLGVKHGIVALTKVDRISDEQIAMVTNDVKNYLYGTFLADSAIMPMSNITGAGFGEFYDALKELVSGICPKRIDGIFRMPVENSFSIKGFGTIVSGIPISGAASVGDEVVLLPDNIRGRVKTIQVYSQLADKVQAGQCAAVGIPQMDHKLIRRGSTIALPGYFQAESWFLAQLGLLEHEKLTLKNGSRVKFHTGTSEVIATVYLTGADVLGSGQSDIVQIRTKEPIVAGPADRFIIRSLSPVDTIGGGAIIESIAKRLKRSDASVLDDIIKRAQAVENELDYTEYYLRKADNVISDINIIARATKIAPARVSQLIAQLVAQGSIIELMPGQFIHKDVVDRIKSQTLTMVRAYHQSTPQSPGMPADSIHQSFDLPKKLFDIIVSDVGSGVKLAGGRLIAADFKPAVSNELQNQLDAVEKLFKIEQFKPPKPADIAQLSHINATTAAKALNVLKDNGVLIEIERGIFFHAAAIEAARQMIIDYIRKEGGLESVQFKYMLETTRKFAIPLLDYFDNIGLTRRDGYTRLLRGKH